MTREEERRILHQNMNHYLWKKPRADWTAKDLENLEGKSVSGITIPADTVKIPKKQPVIAKKTRRYRSI
jgi:hypothetical protein